MITIYYSNIDKLSDSLFETFLSSLPEAIQESIMRFKFMKDRKLKLLGRLLIKYYHHINNISYHVSDIQFTDKGKPYLEQGIEFNISHSGKIVMVGFSDYKIGVDIEKESGVGVDETYVFFHPDEIKWIKDQPFPKKAFLRLWTRKEAYLKATGTGISNNLREIICLNDFVHDEINWYLTDFEFEKDYNVAICSPQKDFQFNFTEIIPEELFEMFS